MSRPCSGGFRHSWSFLRDGALPGSVIEKCSRCPETRVVAKKLTNG